MQTAKNKHQTTSTLWDSMTTSQFPKRIRSSHGLGPVYTYQKSVPHENLLKSQPQPSTVLPAVSVKRHLLGSPRYSKWGDLCLLQRLTGLSSFPERGLESSRGSIPIFFCKHVNAQFIHHSCRWMGPIIEQKEVPHVSWMLVSTRKKHKIHPSFFLDTCLHLLKTWNEKRL